MAGSKFSVEVGPAARRQLKKLPKAAQKSTISAIEKLADDPRPRGVEKIQGYPNFYRIAVGSFRIIHHIKGNTVVVVVVRDRKDAYRGLDDLDTKLNGAISELREVIESQIPENQDSSYAYFAGLPKIF